MLQSLLLLADVTQFETAIKVLSVCLLQLSSDARLVMMSLLLVFGLLPFSLRTMIAGLLLDRNFLYDYLSDYLLLCLFYCIFYKNYLFLQPLLPLRYRTIQFGQDSRVSLG